MFKISGIYPLTLSCIAHNVPGLGAVAASNTFSTRATVGENSKICPREVMPPLRQTLVIRCGCLPKHCPINGIFPVESRYPNWSAGKPEARYGVAISCCAVCNIVFVRWSLWAATRYCKRGKVTSLLFHYLSRYFSQFTCYP